MLAEVVEFYGLDVLRQMTDFKANTIETAIDQVALSKLLNSIYAIHYGQEQVDKRLKELESELYEQYREDKIAME